MVWRFTGARTRCRRTRSAGRRKAVAVSFWLLAPYLVIHVAHDLDAGHRLGAHASLGIAVTTISLVSMPVLGLAKRRLGARLGSPADLGRGDPEPRCARAVAAGVLAGLGLNTIGWWWVDPLVALALAGVARARDGRPGTGTPADTERGARR